MEMMMNDSRRGSNVIYPRFHASFVPTEGLLRGWHLSDSQNQKRLHRSLYTERDLHRAAFTQTLLHTEAFTYRSFYTQELLHTHALQKEAFRHRHF